MFPKRNKMNDFKTVYHDEREKKKQQSCLGEFVSYFHGFKL